MEMWPTKERIGAIIKWTKWALSGEESPDLALKEIQLLALEIEADISSRTSGKRRLMLPPFLI